MKKRLKSIVSSTSRHASHVPTCFVKADPIVQNSRRVSQVAPSRRLCSGRTDRLVDEQNVFTVSRISKDCIAPDAYERGPSMYLQAPEPSRAAIKGDTARCTPQTTIEL